MLKIPFAIESTASELVEVGQVRSGRSCGCVCPSCGQSVIARQGDINQWHFAHDNKGVEPPKLLCEISFYVCCKRFVIAQLIKNETLILSTQYASIHCFGDMIQSLLAKIHWIRGCSSSVADHGLSSMSHKIDSNVLQTGFSQRYRFIVSLTKGVEMQITTVASKENYEVRLFEFISPSARTITSFYQLVMLPNTSLGCFDVLEDVLLKLENPELIEADLIEKSCEYFLGERVLIGKDELISGIL